MLNEEPIRILVVEDDPDMRIQLAGLLEDEGYEVESAERGSVALGLARARPFDLVVTDIRMEGMSGLDVIEQVQQEMPRVQSLVITGYSTEADSIRAVKLGVGDYLKKPFRRQDFLASVEQRVQDRRRELDQRRAQQALRHMALGAVRSLARLSSPHARPLRAGEIGVQLGEELGLAPETREEVELAALLHPLLEQPGVSDWATAVPAVGEIVEQLNRDYEQVGLRTRVVAVALAAAAYEREHEEEPASMAMELAGMQPGRYDPAVLEALDRLHQGRSVPVSRLSGGHRRGLLSLAQALEAAGDREAALGAFQELLDDSTPSREAVVAGLALSRLNGGDRPLLQQAVERARALGPVTTGTACLEAGLASNEVTFLDEAVRLLSQTRMQGAEALARLALARARAMPDEVLLGPLQFLLRPEQRGEYASSAGWLVPFLLERQAAVPHPVLEKALVRMAADFPLELKRQLDAGRLGPGARRALMQALLAGEGSSPLLQQLSGDADPEVSLPARKALASSGPVTLPTLRVYSLGNFEAYRGEERIPETDWKTRKVKYVFAYLCAYRSRPVNEDVLVEEFWSEDAEKGRRSLHSATSMLRACLRPSYWEGPLDLVIRKEGRLQINPELPTWHDLQELEQALALAAAGPQAVALEQARKIAQLYRGPYLDGWYNEWVLGIRARLEGQVASLLYNAARHCLAQKLASEATEHAQRVLEIDPCHQPAHLLLMQSHLASGRAELAVRQFEKVQKVLRQELDMEPSTEMHEIHQRALLSLS